MLSRATERFSKERALGDLPMQLRHALYPQDGTGSQVERFAIARLDDHDRVLDVEVLHQGSFSETPACSDQIFGWMPRRPGASRRFAPAHNHPNGRARPSPEDIGATRRLLYLSILMELELVHDFVISATDSYDVLRAIKEARPKDGAEVLRAFRQDGHVALQVHNLCRADRMALEAMRVAPAIAVGLPFRHRGENTDPPLLAPCTKETLDRLIRFGAVQRLPRSPGRPTLYRLA